MVPDRHHQFPDILSFSKDVIGGPTAVRPVEWRGLNDQGRQVSSGVYFYKLVTKDYANTRKMVLLK